MSWNKICKALNCCKRKPVLTPTPHNSAQHIDVSVARNTAPGHRYTDTMDVIHEVLNSPKI
jgi:hypothetical protein